MWLLKKFRAYQNRNRYINDYILGNTLDIGTFGKIKLATHRLTGNTVALKIMDTFDPLKPIEKSFYSEIIALQSLNHPNIIHIKFILQNYDYPRKWFGKLNVMIIGLELAQCNLDQCLKPFSDKISLGIFKQLLYALDYCHHFGMCHRDVKLANILISNDYHILLADFGLSSTHSQRCITNCGTLFYMSPEIAYLCKGSYDGSKSDIWSSGICLLKLVTKINYSYYEYIQSSNWKKIWSDYPHVSTFIKQLIEIILIKDPIKRLSASTLLSYLIDIDSNISDDLRSYFGHC